jgi:transcriptional regulator with XRE-family HTH domain
MYKKSQRELARAIGCSESSISLILRGKRRPSLDLALLLEKETKISWKKWLRPEVYGWPKLKKASD